MKYMKSKSYILEVYKIYIINNYNNLQKNKIKIKLIKRIIIIKSQFIYFLFDLYFCNKILFINFPTYL